MAQLDHSQLQTLPRVWTDKVDRKLKVLITAAEIPDDSILVSVFIIDLALSIIFSDSNEINKPNVARIDIQRKP